MNFKDFLFENNLNPFKSTTSIPNYDEMMEDPEYWKDKKGVAGEVVWMSPDEYMKQSWLAKKTVAPTLSFKEDLKDINMRNIKKYAQNMTDGDKFNMPSLEAHKGFQEGRHRALAAKSIGIDKIPVFVVTKL